MTRDEYQAFTARYQEAERIRKQIEAIGQDLQRIEDRDPELRYGGSYLHCTLANGQSDLPAELRERLAERLSAFLKFELSQLQGELESQFAEV